MTGEALCPYCNASLKGSDDVEHMWLTTIKHGRVYLILCKSCRKVLGTVGGGL